MVLLIDNYDSFSYNLYQLIGEFDSDIRVIRNDAISIDEVKRLHPDYIVISPGPGRPSDAGICIDLITQLYARFPILGICLGHQAVFEAFGGVVSYAKNLMHGKPSEIRVNTQNALFKDLPSEIKVARYHSLAAVKDTIPDVLQVTAWAADHEIMSVTHKKHPVYGVQFHPESILTPQGKIIVQNFLGRSPE